MKVPKKFKQLVAPENNYDIEIFKDADKGKVGYLDEFKKFISLEGGKQVEVIDGTNTSVIKVETDEKITYQVNVNVRAEDDFADDVAAGLGGIVVGGLYHNAGEVRVRLPEVVLNFDVTADWTLTVDSVGAVSPVTDEASFRQYLTDGANGNNNLTNIVITNFSLIGGRLRCNLTAGGTRLILNEIDVTDVFGVVNLSSLQYLYLGDNQIVTFNPTIALPSSLKVLEIGDNQIVTFNPTIALPSSLTSLGLYGNQMTLAGYAASESWANAQPSFTNPCTIDFSGNPDSITGTNLETILLTKNVIIVA